MEQVLKLYIYVNGIEDTPFPNAEEQMEIHSFKYTASRMGGAPSITATAKHRLCLDGLWNVNVYAEFNGERYYIMNTPSSSKNNEDTRYEYDIELLSEREKLNHRYFLDTVQGDATVDRYLSNSPKVYFMGDIQEFVGRLNSTLQYSDLDYTAVIDAGITSESKLVSFENLHILEALQQIYNVYSLPYYFVGKVIHVGYVQNAIPYVFKYGIKDALLSIERNNANYEVVRRCSGYGSSDNLPYFYPNSTPSGTAIYETENIEKNDVQGIDLGVILRYNANVYNDTFTLCSLPSQVNITLIDTDSAFKTVVKYTSWDGIKLKVLETDTLGKDSYADEKLSIDDLLNLRQSMFKCCHLACFKIWLEKGGDYTFQWQNYIEEPSLTEYDDGPLALKRNEYKFYRLDAVAADGDSASASSMLARFLPDDSSLLVDSDWSEGAFELAIGNTSGLPEFIAPDSGYYFIIIKYRADYAPNNIKIGQDLYIGVKVGGRFGTGTLNATCKYNTSGFSEDYFFTYNNDKRIGYSDSGIRLLDVDDAPKALYNITHDKYGHISISSVASELDAATKIRITGRTWIIPSEYLMPPIYRQTNGEERFYNAENNKYPKDDGDYYSFVNLYTDHTPNEWIEQFEDIKPTIKGLTNAAGERIDMFLEFAYDENDSDEFDPDNNNEYLHPYFFAKLKKFDGEFGFNLFDHASESGAMQITMQDGVCGACTFDIGVGEETNKNTVQVDSSGNLLRDEDGNVRCGREGLPEETPQDRQNDTINYEVWIALKKDNSTYKDLMPNKARNLRPSANDTFEILNINMPQAYIDNAEKRLEKAIIDYMWQNNTEKFTFSIGFSRIYFAENPNVLTLLNENSSIIVEYNNIQNSLYVSNFEYNVNETEPLPEIVVDLTDNLSIGQNSIQNLLNTVEQNIVNSIRYPDVVTLGSPYFLRKDIADSAYKIITFLQGFLVGSGAYGIDNLGNAILNEIKVAFATITSADISEITSNVIFRDLATFLYGIVGDDIHSSDFLQGYDGFSLTSTPGGRSRLEVDELLVRVKAIFNELEIRKLSYAGGNMELSGAGSTIVRVRPLVREGEAEPYAWRCFLLKDDGTTRTRNWWRAGDMAKCQTFNLDGEASPTARLLSLGGRLISADAAGSPLGYGQARQGNAGNRYYWRLVTATGTETLEDGRDYDYVELSNEKEVALTDTDGVEVRCVGYDEVFDGFDETDGGMKWHADANDAPAEGDEIVQEGSQTDPDRQHLIRLVTVGENAPAIEEYCGVGAHDKGDAYIYNLSARRVTAIAPRTGNVFRARRFEIETEGGMVTRMPVYRGDWQQGKTYYYYEQVAHGGGLWLCVSQVGTQAEPADGSAAWQLQVSPGADGQDGTDGTDGQDGTDGALSAVRAYFTPTSLVVSDNGDGFDLSDAELNLTVMRGFQEEITSSCQFTYDGTGCTVEQGDYPYMCRITGIVGEPERAQVRANIRVPAQYAGGSPDTMTAYADVAVNYPGQFRETIENDVKRQVAGREFTYVGEDGELHTVEGISQVVQSAEGLLSEVWRRQPAGSVVANGSFADGLEKWAATGEVEATRQADGIPCARARGEGECRLEQGEQAMLCDWGAMMQGGQAVDCTLSLRVSTATGCTVRAALYNGIDGELASWEQAFGAAEGAWVRAGGELQVSQVPTGLRVSVTPAGSTSTQMDCCVTDVQLIPDITQALGSKIEQTAMEISMSVASVEQGLEDTGIRIGQRKIEATADNFVICNNRGEQTMRVDEDGQLNIRQLKVDDLAGSKARVEIGQDADGNPYLVGFNKDGVRVWLFDGSISLNYGDGVLMHIQATSSAAWSGGKDYGIFEAHYSIRVLVTNLGSEALTFDSQALECRVDDWRTSGGTDYISLPPTSRPEVGSMSSAEYVFSLSVRKEYGETESMPTVSVGDPLTVTAWYDAPGKGWTKLDERVLAWAKGGPIPVNP